MSLRTKLLGLFALLAVAPLLVVSVYELPVPFGRARVYFFVAIAVVTFAAFLLALEGIFRSLEELTTAAERIGEGDFSPWLPPPGEGEVGRLSLAVGTMAERLQDMMVEVERSSRLSMVGELSQYVAHEIRNPLSSIRLNLQSLERGLERGAPEHLMSESLGLCLSEIERLDRVVSAILAFGRVDPLVPEPISVHRCMTGAIDVALPEFDRHRVELNRRLLAETDIVAGDADQLGGAFLNLLLNGAQACSGGAGSVTVRTRSEASNLVIEISDDGPGVPKEMRGRIFEPFFTTRSDGSGIGLPLAARVFEEHGGRLALLASDPGAKGATFRVTLPLLPAAPSTDRARTLAATGAPTFTDGIPRIDPPGPWLGTEGAAADRRRPSRVGALRAPDEGSGPATQREPRT